MCSCGWQWDDRGVSRCFTQETIESAGTEPGAPGLAWPSLTYSIKQPPEARPALVIADHQPSGCKPTTVVSLVSDAPIKPAKILMDPWTIYFLLMGPGHHAGNHTQLIMLQIPLILSP